MERIGLIVNLNRLFKYWLFLIIGLSLIFYGIIGNYENNRQIHMNLSDNEIIERAKALGMVDLKDQLIENTNNE
ncbi:hypothetical protein [Fusibacter sp. 3D3]|uniref:hypothetical protein n=1 Tax=Fusibacter sp. 3D3 TaxID=1048380 RepID=UPI0008537A93|nr:hypothetical protein [Fusibacter sp. 3D3]GAU79317.1 hypothetical protein F3D3_3976 [Fusibacter sp. 3D3]